MDGKIKRVSYVNLDDRRTREIFQDRAMALRSAYSATRLNIDKTLDEADAIEWHLENSKGRVPFDSVLRMPKDETTTPSD